MIDVNLEFSHRCVELRSNVTVGLLHFSPSNKPLQCTDNLFGMTSFRGDGCNDPCGQISDNQHISRLDSRSIVQTDSHVRRLVHVQESRNLKVMKSP